MALFDALAPALLAALVFVLPDAPALLDEPVLLEVSADDEDEEEELLLAEVEGEAQEISTSTPLYVVVFISAGAEFVEALVELPFMSD